MLGAFAETSAAAAVLPRHFVLSPRKPHNKFHGIQNWVSKGSYKTRIWFSQKGRSAGFYVSSELLGLGVLFPASQSVTVFLRQFQLATALCTCRLQHELLRAIPILFHLWLGCCANVSESREPPYSTLREPWPPRCHLRSALSPRHGLLWLLDRGQSSR